MNAKTASTRSMSDLEIIISKNIDSLKAGVELNPTLAENYKQYIELFENFYKKLRDLNMDSVDRYRANLSNGGDGSVATDDKIH